MQIVTNQFQKELKQHGSDDFPLLVSYEQLSGYPSGSFLWHWHPEIEITLVTEGRMLYKVNHCSFHMKEGDILFGNANALHAGFMDGDSDCKYTSLTFDPKLVYGFSHSAVRRKYVEPVLQDFSMPAIHIDYSSPWHAEFGEKVRNIIRYSEEKPALYEMDVVMELQAVWKLILENKNLETTVTAHDRTEYERIREIMDYLEKNYMNKILLKDVAKHIHLCESECSRLFKRYMNTSLFTFLQEYRVERSLEYLADPGLPVTEVAARAGFTDSNYYSKVFAKVKGCSPQKYRKKQQL